MSSAPRLTAFGVDLTRDDFANLAGRWITPELAEDAGLRRVDSLTGCQMFARQHGNLAGLIIPNMAPWDDGRVREYRLRLDHPPIEQKSDGTLKESNKYLQPPERRNLQYFPPGISLADIVNPTIPLIITEGEFKALALQRLALYNSEQLRFVPVAIAGVWNFFGTIGKVTGPNGDRQDVKGLIPDFDRLAVKGRPVIIAFDADAEQNPKVRAARSRLSSLLIERGAMVGNLVWPMEQGKGIDDRLATVGPDQVLASIARLEFGGWRSRLIRNEDGRVLGCYDNVALFLENDPEWHGVLACNEFTGGYVVVKSPPSPLTAQVGEELQDHFDVELVRWLERHRLMVKPEMVAQVVDLIARRNSYHPVRDYLYALPPWDGIKRISTWLIDYCGVESSDERPNRYAMAVGERFLISAVKRILEPGVKCDSMLVLEGPQGIGESSVARILAGDDWFTDHLSEMGSKDASMQLRGVWIVELGELEALSRVEMSRAKLFISQQVERFRLPYGRRTIQMPRQCVFIGTTNSDTWLRDETGGRRFWPVRCSTIDLAGLRRDRDQLWAEALNRCLSDEPWWLDDEEMIQAAMEEQRGRMIEDPWYPKVIDCAEAIADSFVSGSKCGTAAIPEILQRLGLDISKQDQVASNRVARCLRSAGWVRRYTGSRNNREWRYERPQRGRGA